MFAPFFLSVRGCGVLFGCSQVEGKWEMARRILKSLHLQNMDVDVVAYGAAIGACGRKGR